MQKILIIIVNPVRSITLIGQKIEIFLWVCTNKQEKLAIDLLKKLNLYKYFEYVAGCDTFSL